MTDQFASAAPSARTVQLSGVAWLSAAIIPIAFIICLFAMIVYVAPEYDDWCFFDNYINNGFFHVIVNQYFAFSGRMLPFVLIQLPSVIAYHTGIGILASYWMVLAPCMMFFVGACAFAIVRCFPDIHPAAALFMAAAFVSAILGATPDLHDLLYWNAALACYVPPAVISIVILGDCVRALDLEAGFSWRGAIAMASGGLIASLCNEYTGMWLIMIVAASVVARLHLDQKAQLQHHGLILTAVFIGTGIVLLAPGNSVRLGLAGGLRISEIGYLAPRALNYAVLDLGDFLSSPTVISWSIMIAVLSLAFPPKRSHPRGALLASGVIVVVLGCCYFEYLTAHLSTGIRLVDRAVNQALILMSFGLTLSITLLVRTEGVRRRLAILTSISLDSVGLAAILGMIFAISLAVSPTGVQLRRQWRSFAAFREENIERDRLLEGSEKVVVLQLHKSRPSLLLGEDIEGLGRCIGGYYNKTIEVR